MSKNYFVNTFVITFQLEQSFEEIKLYFIKSLLILVDELLGI